MALWIKCLCKSQAGKAACLSFQPWEAGVKNQPSKLTNWTSQNQWDLSKIRGTASDQGRTIKEDTSVNLRPPFEHTPAHTCTTYMWIWLHTSICAKTKQNVVIGLKPNSGRASDWRPYGIRYPCSSILIPKSHSLAESNKFQSIA